jgi:microcystin-dependent protein
MSNKLSDRNKKLTFVPDPQSPDSAGFMTTTADDVVPTGWLEADGQAVSRTTYSELFNLIGTAYGDGDGSTTFNLPSSVVADITSRTISTDLTIGTGSDKKQLMMTDAEITNSAAVTIKSGSNFAWTGLTIEAGSSLTIEAGAISKQLM